MRYNAMAKHWIYEKAKQAIPEPETGLYLDANKVFTDGELHKFINAVNKELYKMEDSLRKQGIIT